MDGIGLSGSRFGNAVACARTPNMRALAMDGAFTSLLAHGTAVGLPSDADIGNSEVGHNALGAGRIFDQGAKLVQKAIDDGSVFSGATWTDMIAQVRSAESTLHFLGLLSDGNVHSHEQHLYAMMRRAKRDGVKKVRVHVLLDGRDVSEKSAEVYVDRLQKVMSELRSGDFDVRIASGGGRMKVTMDRYEADWDMVQAGWHCHVHGEGRQFADINAVLQEFRKDAMLTDQYFPAFVIAEAGRPVGPISDHDAVILFNFRGDRAIEISRAFTDDHLTAFDRGRRPKVMFAGMMEYDGDLHIPSKYLVSPPAIADTLGEHLAKNGLRQFACSETQKFGHVTFFWNGNRSGLFDKKTEEYVEIPSDRVEFDRKPWMKAYEICETTIDRMTRQTFDYGRINFPNGDMVGHTGNFEAAVVAVETVDLMLRRLRIAAAASDTILMVTADHGNADEMFDAKAKDFPDWENLPLNARPKPKTAHTINPVPLYIFDPRGQTFSLKSGSLTTASPESGTERRTLAHVANTVLDLMGMPQREDFLPSLLVRP